MSHPVNMRAAMQVVCMGGGGGVRGCCSQGDHKVKLAYCSNYESGKGEQVQETLEACRCLTSVSGGEQKNILRSALLS